MRRALAALGLVLTVIALEARPAGACSCAAPADPSAVEFTGTAVELVAVNRGQIGDDVVWAFDVTDAVRGVGDGDTVDVNIETGTHVGEDGMVSQSSCGTDGALIEGESYRVTADAGSPANVGACTGSVEGARAASPPRPAPPPDTLPLNAAIVGALLVTAIAAVAIVGRRAHR